MFLLRGMWSLGLCKAVKYFKCGLMGPTSRSMEDASTGGDWILVGLAPEISEEKNFSM